MSPQAAWLKARKAALRSSLALSQRAARARVDQHPAVRRARAQRRRRRTVGLTVVLLLLLLLSRCECDPPPPPPPGPAKVEMPAPEKPKLPAPPPVPARVKRPPLRARAEPVQRGDLATKARGAPVWLEELRTQVSARSPRLARCFNGAERPGALRWTASLNPASGWVSEHELEPVGQAVDLSKAQRDCLVLGLSSPAYRITRENQGEQKATVLPERISLVIEF
jgi:hypothetical protein